MRKLLKYNEFLKESVDKENWDSKARADDSFNSTEEWHRWQNKYLIEITKSEFKCDDDGIDICGDHFPLKRLVDIVRGYTNYYSGYDESIRQMWDHIGTAMSLYDRGGTLYRLIYADSEDDINKEELGGSWTISTYEIDTLVNTVTGWVERNVWWW